MKRGLTINDAADYCGVTVVCFRMWVRDGLVPGPWPGTKRYDKQALDKALDSLSGINQNVSPYDEWRARQESAHQAETY